MLAFAIYVNGKRVCTAGLDEFGVVSSILSWVRREPSTGKRKTPDEVRFSVGGLVSRTNSHVDWHTRRIKKGDRIRIEVVDVASVDRPRAHRLPKSNTKGRR